MQKLDPCYELQKCILSSLLLWGNDELKKESEDVLESDFTNDFFKLVFVKLKENSFNFQLLLSDKEVSESVEGRNLISDLRAGAYEIGGFSEMLIRLREINSQIRLKNMLAGFVFSETDYTTDDVLQALNAEINQNTNSDIIRKARENVDKYILELDNKPKTLSTGYRTVDDVLGGIRLPSVFVIGARPSTGKTAFALNLALGTKVKTAVFSLEMSAEMIIDRLVSCYHKWNYDNISKRRLDEKQKTIIRSFAEWTKGKIDIVDDIYGIEQIAIAIRKLKPTVAIIDYVQIVGSANKFRTEREKVNYIMSEIRIIAKQNNCCIIVLSQITRGGKTAPTMSDLMESGAIEANADYVLLMHRPYVLDKKDPNLHPEQLQVVVDKNRFGGTKLIDLCFLGEFQRIIEVERRYE